VKRERLLLADLSGSLIDTLDWRASPNELSDVAGALSVTVFFVPEYDGFNLREAFADEIGKSRVVFETAKGNGASGRKCGAFGFILCHGRFLSVVV
jgi:CO dehydrogenase/acetyl-CoA synthase beta subunit